MPASNLFLASKVVVNREAPSILNIPGEPTSIAAFVGVFERGPFVPTFHTSFESVRNTYGTFIVNSKSLSMLQGFFENGGTAVWVLRTAHYTDITDSATLTALRGSFNLEDRGGAAGPATIDSAAAPFDLEPGEVLEVNVDGSGPDTLAFTAVSALVTTDPETFALVDGDTLVYQTKLPTSDQLTEQRTITFLTADFAAIGTATAQELANVINRDGIGISAVVNAGTVEIRSDKRGSDAQIVLAASSTSLVALGLTAGTTTGTGNVLDIDAVTATELATLLTGVLSAGTATVVGGVVRLSSTATGLAASVVITANTTASGIFAGTLPVTVNGSDAAVSDTLQAEGKDPGAYISNYSIEIQNATSGDLNRFNLLVKRGTATVESFPNLSLDLADSRYAPDFVNDNSQIIRLTDLSSPATSPSNLPALGTFNAWAGQDDGLTGLVDSDFVGSDAGDTGFYAFDVVDNIRILFCDRATAAVHNAMVTYCDVHRTKFCFAVLDSPEGLSAQEVKTYYETTAGLSDLSEVAAFYWPKVFVLNPSTAVFGSSDRILVPPAGHIAGTYARIDASAPGGVYIPPAGIQNGILFGVLGFETEEVLDERKRDVVYPVRINPLTAIDGSARHIDGTRTLSDVGSFPTVAESRGVIFISTSIKAGLLFAKHRNNDARLRNEIYGTVFAFLLRQFENGAFAGETAAESFYVDVSEGLNTPEVIASGFVKVRIGLATQKPADFIDVIITQDTRAIQERIASVQ